MQGRGKPRFHCRKHPRGRRKLWRTSTSRTAGSLFHPRRTPCRALSTMELQEEISLTHYMLMIRIKPVTGRLFQASFPFSVRYLSISNNTTSKLAAWTLNANLVAKQASKCCAIFCQVLAVLTSELASPCAKERRWMCLVIAPDSCLPS